MAGRVTQTPGTQATTFGRLLMRFRLTHRLQQRRTQDSALVSYQPYLLHDLANQRQRRRDAEYDRPDWSKTVKSLANGAPATVADLHALLVAELRDQAK